MAVFTAAQALEMALEIEKNGELFYSAAAGRSDDAKVRSLFEDLAAQEKQHYKAFEKMLGGVQPAPSLPPERYDEYQAYLQVALDNALFAGPDKALAMAEQAEGREAALRAALGFEKDTMLFFFDLREMVGEADRASVTAIIQEERKHLRRLTELLRS
jgi:rubrerythrin